MLALEALVDQFGTPITEENFKIAVRQYLNCSNFFIEIVFDENYDVTIYSAEVMFFTHSTAYSNILQLTIFFQQRLKNFLLEKKKNFILFEYERTKQLSVRNRIILVKCLKLIIEEEYDDNASQFQIINICKAAISLFPYLKYEPSQIDGIVSIKMI